ncbi:MAG: leucine-rich repeat protein [Clostridia bacterium]|nr:leucine-rich repeat protein [Clostridia bacterium]
MVKWKKVMVSLTLSVLLYVTMFLSFVVHANDSLAGYEINDAGELKVMALRSELVIPSIVQGITVRKIVDVRAVNGVVLTAVEIPNTVEEIGSGAFRGDDDSHSILSRNVLLESVTIPESVKIIGSGAFEYNRLKNLVIPNSVKEIGNGAFAHNKLENLTIANSVETIVSGAFAHNNIKDLTIPASVKEIGDGAFVYNSVETLKFLGKDTNIGYAAFAVNQLKDISLPSESKVIPGAMFADNPLEKVTIPEGIEEIGDYALYSKYKKYTDVIIPGSVKKIGKFVVGGENEVKSVTVLNANAEIDSDAFFKDKTVVNVKKICGYKWSTAEEYALKNDIQFEPLADMEYKGIKYKIDYNTKKLTITGITSKADIEKYYPYGLNIPETVDVGKEKCTVSAIADEALKDLPVKKILMPDTIETIGNKAFANNKITEIILSRNLKSIGDNVFEDCTQLEWIYIPEATKTIGASLFKNNTIVTIYCHTDSVAEISAKNAGRPIYEVDKPYQGEGTGDCAVDGICYQLNKTDKTAVVTGMKNEITRKIFGNLKNVIIPKQMRVGRQTYEVRGVGANAIKDQLIETVSIEDGVKQVGLKAFKGCSNLKKIDIPSSATYIDIQAFEDCDKLQEINIAEGGDYSYQDNILCRCAENGKYSRLCGWLIPCSDVTYFNVYGYSSVESRAFVNCKSLETVEIPELFENISNDAFEGIKEQIVIEGLQDSFAYKYADKHGIKFKCDGFSYFSQSPFWGNYSYSFTNSAENFRSRYYIGFLRNFVENNIAERADGDYGDWDGACFGMVATAKLFYEGLLTPSLWSDDISVNEEENAYYKVWYLDEPKKNHRLEYLINFYQVFNWLLADESGAGAVFKPIVKRADARRLVGEIRNGTESSYVCTLDSYHTVLILGKPEILDDEFKKEHGTEFSNYTYRIEIYNPNSLYREYIYVNSTSNIITIGDINTVNKYYTTYDYANLYWVDLNDVWTIESLIEDDRKVAFNEDGASIWIKWYRRGLVELFVMNASLFIEGDIQEYSKYYVIDQFEEMDGDLYCDVEEVIHPKESESNAQIEAGLYSTTEVKIKEDGIYRVQNVDNTEPLDIDILFKDSYMYAKTKAGGSATFENKKFVSITNPSGEEFETKLVLNDEFVTLPWYGITVSGKGTTELKLEMTEDGVLISGADLKNITVSGNNTEETVELNVNTKRNKVLLKANDEETKLVAYIDRDGDGTFETPLEFIEEENLAIDDEDENTEGENEEENNGENNKDNDNETKGKSEDMGGNKSEDEKQDDKNTPTGNDDNSQKVSENEQLNGKSTKAEKNAQTGDNIALAMVVLGIAIVCIAFTELKREGNSKMEK